MKRGIAFLVVFSIFTHVVCGCAPATTVVPTPTSTPTPVSTSTPTSLLSQGESFILREGKALEAELPEAQIPADLPQTIPAELLAEPYWFLLGVMSKLDKHFESQELEVLPVVSPLAPGQSRNLPDLPQTRLLVWETQNLGQKGDKPFCFALGGNSYQVLEVSGSTALLDIEGTWRQQGWWVQWEVGEPPNIEPRPYAKEMIPTGRLFLASEIGGQERLWIEGRIRSPDSYFGETVFLPVDFLLEQGVSLEIPFIQEIVRVHTPLEGWDRNDTYKALAIGAAILVGGALLIYGGQVIGVLPQGFGGILGGLGGGLLDAAVWVTVRGARVGFILLKGAAYAITLTLMGIGAALWKVVPVVWATGKEVVAIVGEGVVGPLLKTSFELGFKLIEIAVSGTGSLIRWIIRIIPFIGLRFEADLLPRRFALAQAGIVEKGESFCPGLTF